MNLIRDAKGNAQKCPCVQLHTGGISSNGKIGCADKQYSRCEV
nr:MAG TPA: hypothetical protein [Caudoviricetes sp.]